MTLRLPPNFLDCYVCRQRVDPKDPYPQLCAGHMANPSASLAELEALAESLNFAFSTTMLTEYDDRMTAVMTAARDVELPGVHYVKTKRMAELLRRIEATVAKGDAFAHIVENWWNARQATVDAEKLALQIAWMPISAEVRRDRQS